MPEMDGYQATIALRDQHSRARNHDIPVIALTANAMSEDRDRCFRAGMDDYLSKPFEPHRLRAVVEKWLHHGEGAHSGERP
jgi:CheY-like chemotaxis protein